MIRWWSHSWLERDRCCASKRERNNECSFWFSFICLTVVFLRVSGDISFPFLMTCLLRLALTIRFNEAFVFGLRVGASCCCCDALHGAWETVREGANEVN